MEPPVIELLLVLGIPAVGLFLLSLVNRKLRAPHERLRESAEQRRIRLEHRQQLIEGMRLKLQAEGKALDTRPIMAGAHAYQPSRSSDIRPAMIRAAKAKPAGLRMEKRG